MDSGVLGGRYQLGEPLGRGGMATVYRARDTLLHRDVAVKVFASVDLPDQDARRAAEVHLLAGLSHPSLVTVFDAGSGGGERDPFAYLVMELVDGQTLRHLLAEGRLGARETGELGVQLAGALAYIHARGVVHRDLKPANILLTELAPGRRLAKLTDFGVARLLDGTRLTTEGSTVGTANYLSPEQATGAPITGASDIYSFGLVLIECRTGEVAYPGHGVEAAVARLHRPPDIPAALGPAWVELLARMTDRDPARRPNADQVADALQRLAVAGDAPVASLRTPLAPLGPPPGPPPTAVSDEAPTEFLSVVPEAAPTERPARRRLLPALVAAAVLLAAAITAIVLATSGSDTPAAGLSYPRVGASEAEPLLALEQAVGSIEPLHSDVLTIARAVAANDRAGVLAGLNRLGADVAAALRSGRISAAQAAMITTAMSAVRAHLPGASSSPSSSSPSSSPSPSSSRASPSPSRTSTSASVARTTRPVIRHTSAPKPAPKPKPKPKPKKKPHPGPGPKGHKPGGK